MLCCTVPFCTVLSLTSPHARSAPHAGGAVGRAGQSTEAMLLSTQQCDLCTDPFKVHTAITMLYSTQALGNKSGNLEAGRMCALLMETQDRTSLCLFRRCNRFKRSFRPSIPSSRQALLPFEKQLRRNSRRPPTFAQSTPLYTRPFGRLTW